MDSIFYLDAHEVSVAAPPEDVWAALQPALTSAFGRRRARAIAQLLECEDDGAPGEMLAGFHVGSSEPPRALTLEGQHRFSRYRLAFEIEPADSGSRLRAVTHAQFPGLKGRLYRSLVVGTGGHRIVTRRLLRSIARHAERNRPAAPTMLKEAT